VDNGFAPQCARAAQVCNMMIEDEKKQKVPKRAQEIQDRKGSEIGNEEKVETSKIGRDNRQRL
jgi:hypothetical protein